MGLKIATICSISFYITQQFKICSACLLEIYFAPLLRPSCVPEKAGVKYKKRKSNYIPIRNNAVGRGWGWWYQWQPVYLIYLCIMLLLYQWWI